MSRSPQSEEGRSGGENSWVAFLAGIILVAVVAFGVVAYTGGWHQREVPVAHTDIPPPENEQK